jgi:hypothetical protein
MNLEAIKDAQGANLYPGKLILHHDETQLLFTDKNDRSRVFCYDMEACKIASEFKYSDYTNITDITNISQEAQK